MSEDKQTVRRNKRTGLILFTIAAMFFLGILIRKLIEPDILSLVN